jgi:hypothetical protein
MKRFFLSQEKNMFITKLLSPIEPGGRDGTIEKQSCLSIKKESAWIFFHKIKNYEKFFFLSP